MNDKDVKEIKYVLWLIVWVLAIGLAPKDSIKNGLASPWFYINLGIVVVFYAGAWFSKYRSEKAEQFAYSEWVTKEKAKLYHCTHCNTMATRIPYGPDMACSSCYHFAKSGHDY